MDFAIERLKSEFLLPQPAPPPQCDSSPRRLPVVGTGLNEPGAPHAETQSTEREEFSLFKPVSMAAHIRNRSGILLFCLK